MYGAIIGDLAGSIYEYDHTKSIKKIGIINTMDEHAFYSDDTILTIAILDAILNDKNYDKYLREYIEKYKNTLPNFKPYFNTMFSPNLIKWSSSGEIGNSIGNGCMMRISPVGYMFNREKDVIENARLATIPSHNSEEAIKCATTVALIIFYLREGYTKEEIYKKLNIEVKYKPFTKFNLTSYETLNNCLFAFYYSNNFEEAIRNTLYLGGDTDTNCAIVGSMAEALYGIGNSLIDIANDKIPNEFKTVLKKVKKYE